MTKLLFLNAAWMKWYDGMDGDKPVGGGSFIKQHGWGAEIYNFRPSQETMYGYAPVGSVRVERLGAPAGQDSVTDVDVVWVATKPSGGGRHIVGWYANATVFRNEQQALPECTNRPSPENEAKQLPYVVRAARHDCVLLGEAKRTKSLPRKRPGAMGQKAVWYAEGPTNADFRQQVMEYIQEQTQQEKNKANNLEKHKHGAGGEGEAHKTLKEWCARNPQALGLEDAITRGRVEFYFISGDRADIMFERAENRYAVVEVETEGRGAEAGAYQALKYRVLMCAQKNLAVTSDKVQGLLVAWSVPRSVRKFCEKYGIRWLEREVLV